MPKKQPEKKFKTIVYVFLSQNDEPFVGQQVDKQLESLSTDLWDLIATKFPENYLSKKEYFTLLDGETTESGKHSFGSKKVLSYYELIEKVSSVHNFQLFNPKFCTDFENYFRSQDIRSKFLLKNTRLVIQKVAA